MKKKILSIFCIILMISSYIGFDIAVVKAQEIDGNITNEVVESDEENSSLENNIQENLVEDLEKEGINDLEENIVETEKEETEENLVEDEITQEVQEEVVEEQNDEIMTLAAELPLPVKTIENGVYVIYSRLGNSMVIDVNEASTKNEANIHIWQENKVDQQKFRVKFLGDGYYSLTCENSGKVLDVQGAGTTNGTNVQQYEWNNTDAQKWIIKDAGNGYYNIISKCSGLNLDIKNAEAKNGTNVQVWEANGDNAQKFKFVRAEEFMGSQTIKDGIYSIRTALNNSKAVEVEGLMTNSGANVQIWNNENHNGQRFIVTYTGSGLYTIENVNSGKFLDVAGAGKVNGTNVQQYEKNNTTSQKWVIKDAGNGYFNIISRCNGLFLDVKNADSRNGTNVQVWEQNGDNAQKFKFEETDLGGGQTISNGTYVIATRLDENKVLDISEGSKSLSANLQLWDSAKVKQQRFIVTYLGNSFYRIQNLNSGLVLDVQGAGRTNGTNVQQYESNGTVAQEWVIKDVGNGYYNIISRCNGLFLDVSEGFAGNGANMQVYEGNNTSAQQFKFIKAVTDGIDVSQYNGKIDWVKVKNDNDIDFAFVRLGYRGYRTGGFARDSRFDENVKGCLENDIDLGIYFVTQAINYEEGVEEANYTLEQIKGLNVVCPIVIDVENSTGDPPGRADGLSKEQRTEAIRGFCDRIKDAGYVPMIYTSKSWLEDKIDLSKLTYCSIWMAHYVTGAPEKKSNYKGEYLYWQYTSTGFVNGINGYVDLNKGY